MLYGSKLALGGLEMQKRRTGLQGVEPRGKMLAKGITMGAAPTHQPHVPMHTSVLNAKVTDTLLQTATRTDTCVDCWAHHPRYARDLVWDEVLPHCTTLTQFTEIALPLPSPPDNKLNNQVTLDTIACNPHLFKLVTD